MLKMKHLLLAGVLALTALCMVQGAASANLPHDFKEFKARYNREALSEQGAVHIFFEAIYCYMKPETRAEASKMLRFALADTQPIEGMHSRAEFVSRMKDDSYHYIFRSYARGATPENNYSMSPENFALEITRRQTHPDGRITLYLRSSGADSSRPITLVKHDGLWHISDCASIYTMVRKPRNMTDTRRRAIDADNDPPRMLNRPTTVKKRAF